MDEMVVGQGRVVFLGTLGNPYPWYVVEDAITPRSQFLEGCSVEEIKKVKEFEAENINKDLWDTWKEQTKDQETEETKPYLTDEEKQEENEEYARIEKEEAEYEEQRDGMLKQEARECTLWERDEYEED